MKLRTLAALWIAAVLVGLADRARADGSLPALSSADVVAAADNDAWLALPAVVAGSISAEAEAGQVWVAWRTYVEPRSLVFDLQRWDAAAGDWRSVTPDLVAGAVAGGGNAYRVADPGAPSGTAGQYRLLAAGAAGREQVLGPFTLVPRTPAGPAGVLGQAPKGGLRYLEASGPVDLTAGEWRVKFMTTNSGLYRVPASTLATLLSTNETTVRAWLQAGAVGLSNLGRSVSYLPAADGSAFYFYAETLRNNYTDNNYYWLGAGTNLPPASVDGQAPAPVANGSFSASVFREQDLSVNKAVTTDPEMDYWSWTQIPLIQGRSFSQTFVVDELVTNSTLQATVCVRAFGLSTTPNQYSAQVLINGVQVGQGIWTNRTPYELCVAFAPTLLTNGANLLRVNGVNPPGVTGSQWHLNNFLVSWPRRFVATNGVLECAAAHNAVVTVTGFAGSGVAVVEVTDALHPAWVVNTSSGVGEVSFVPASPAGRYTAFLEAQLRAPAAATLVRRTQLAHPTNAVACLYVTSPLLTNTAELVTYRQAQGLSTAAVSVQEVFDEFGFGVPTPLAVRSFLQAALAAWSNQLVYVTLVGNGTYDYRNRFNKGDNLLPPLMLGADPDYGLSASDSVLGDAQNLGFVKLAVGRLPATNNAALAGMIARIKAYEAQTPAANPVSVLVADLADTGGNFPEGISNIAALLPATFTNVLIQGTGSSNLAGVRAQIFSSLNGGSELSAYLGHGSVLQLGREGYLTHTDAAALTNRPRAPILVASTCVAGDYSGPGNPCFTKSWVATGPGGSAAALSASQFGWDGHSSKLAAHLCQMIGENSRPRLGDAVRVGFNRHIALDTAVPATPNAKVYTNLAWIYNLMGDAALVLNLPPRPPSAWLPPVVTLTGPTNPFVLSGSAFTLPATATDPDGAVERVVLLQDGAAVATDWLSPFAFTWTNTTPGAYHYVAVAYDDQGLAATSAVVQVTVPMPPTVTLTGPTNPAVAAGSPFALSVEAFSEVGPVPQVVLLEGGVSVAVDNATPFGFLLTNDVPRLYNYSVVAYDSLGGVATSAVFSVTVALPPTISLTGPTNLALSLNEPFTLHASATAPGGSVERVVLFGSGVWLGEDTTVPFDFNLTNALPGDYDYTAVAYSSLGLAATSIVYWVTVALPPTISLTGPTNLAVPVEAVFTLHAEAADPASVVERVVLWADGHVLGEATAEPFDFATSKSVPGVYGYSAVAYNSFGLAATSGVRVVTVVLPVPVLAISNQPPGQVTLSWEHGVPPFIVERTWSLGEDRLWQNLGGATTNHLLNTESTGSNAFFRVRAVGY